MGQDIYHFPLTVAITRPNRVFKTSLYNKSLHQRNHRTKEEFKYVMEQNKLCFMFC
jgi:hypothetical protein